MFQRCGLSVLMFVTASLSQVCGCCSSVQAQEVKAARTVTYSVSIAGMTCEDCAVHVRQSISKLPGVTKASVDYKAGRAWVTYSLPPDKANDAQRRSLTDLSAAVRRSGYQPTINYVVHIQGMTCEDCSKHVQQALAKVPGVENIQVSYKAGYAVVKPTLKAGNLSESIAAAVNQVGYRSVVHSGPFVK